MHSLVYQVKGALKGFYPDAEALALTKLVLVECLGFSDLELYGGKDKEVFKKDLEVLSEIIGRLKNYEPIQYIIGTEWFGGLSFEVNDSVLIPRPETLELVEWIEEDLLGVEGCRLLDIGTGSGCIAIALKKHCPNWIIQGVDISPEALEVARENSQSNDVNIEWKVIDILSETPDSVDIIVSNPPYICHREKADMHARVLDHEPHTALFVPNDDPLLFYRRIATLKAAPKLFFEINEAYGNEVCEMMAKLGYTDIQLKHDIYGKPRMVFGRIKA